MKVRALRGVCVGVNRHLKPGDVAELEAAMVQFLTGIGAVEIVVDPPAPKPAQEPMPAPEPAPEPARAPATVQVGAIPKPSAPMTGKKEK